MKDRIINGISDSELLRVAPLVKKQAYKYYARLIDQAYTFEDIEQTMDMFICKARLTYDATKSKDFQGWAWFVAKSELLNIIITRVKKLLVYKQDNEDDDDITAEAELAAVESGDEDERASSKFATFKTIGYNNDNDCDFDIPDIHYSITDKISILDKNLDSILDDDIDRKIVRMKFGIGTKGSFNNSDSAIGDALGLTTTCVNTHLKKSLAKLTDYFNR